VVPGLLGGLNEEAPGLLTDAPACEGSAPHRKTNVMTQPLPRFDVEPDEPRVRRQLVPDRRLLKARCWVEMEA